MEALVALVTLIVIPALAAYFASRLSALRTHVLARILVRIVVFALVAAADLIICVNTGLIRE
jgi:hypothetical protein